MFDMLIQFSELELDSHIFSMGFPPTCFFGRLHAQAIIKIPFLYPAVLKLGQLCIIFLLYLKRCHLFVPLLIFVMAYLQPDSNVVKDFSKGFYEI